MLSCVGGFTSYSHENILYFPSVHVSSNVSGSFGCGVFSHPHGWSHCSGCCADIQQLKSLLRWSQQLPCGAGCKGFHVCFHEEKWPVVFIFSQQSAMDSLLSHLLPPVPGILNTAADASAEEIIDSITRKINKEKDSYQFRKKDIIRLWA